MPTTPTRPGSAPSQLRVTVRESRLADAITNPKDLERAWVLCAAAKDPIKELGCFAGGVLPVAKLLSAGGAAAEHPTRLGRTAVWIASYSGRLSVV